MRFEEKISAAVSRPVAWDFLWQTERLARCLPGCTAVEEIEPKKRYRAAFEDAVGPYKVHFDIDVAIIDAEPERSIRLKAFGEDKRIGASQTMDLLLTLASPAGDRTELAIVADVQMHGKIATLGQFVIKRKVKQVVEQFAGNIDAELARAAGQAGA